MTIKGSRRRSATMKALKAMKISTARVAQNLVLAGLGLATLSLVPLAAADLPAGLDLRFELAPAAPLAVPPLPPTEVFPVQLVLDDDSAEGTVGVSDGSGAREFLWFNRFTPPGEPFDLAEVWVLFPIGANIAPGDPVQLAVYLDPDGDPTNGADLVATFAETVQVADGNTFSIYPLAPAVPVYDPGDVLIGVVPRFIEPGDPPTAPAAVDTTASQQRSWIAIWTADPPDPPELPPDVLLDLIDNVAPAAAGNWMIRGFGVPAPVVVIPALGGFGLVLLALVLGAAGLVALRRRHRRAAGMLGVIALAAAAALAPAPASAQVVIDEFSTNQATITDPPGGGSTATGGADIVGGKRGLRVRNLAGPGPTSIGVAGGTLDFAVTATTPDSLGEADVIWDGDADNDPATFDPTGFGTPVDLTDGGTQGAIRITVEAAQAGTHLVLTVYEDAVQISRAGRVLPAIASTTDVFVSFSELIADPDAVGPADLTQVGAITLRIGGSESATPPVLSISHIETAGPAVAAAKVDTVGGVIVTGPQTPGTTLRYRVTIENPDAGAAEGVDFDDVVTDPNLGPPSAIRTTPLARRDQYVTFTDGPIDSAVDGVPSLLDNDVDPDANPLAAVADPGQATAQGGTVTIATDGHFVYTPPLGFVGVDAFNYTVAAVAGDPTADAAGNPIGPIQSIAYVAVDRVPPVITAGGTLLYTENDGPEAIDPALTVVDVDSVNLFGATAEISANYVMGEDVLGFVNTANITGVFVPGTGVLTLTGTDTVAAYEAALRSVTYENTSEDPSELDRTVTWTATDGSETSAPATSTIEVTAVNDPPIVTTSVGSTNFTEDGGPVVVDSMVTVTDADHTSLASATVTITNLLDAGMETLAANTGGTSIVALYAAPTLTLTGPDTVANFQQVLQSVTYNNASQDPNITNRIVRFVANDGVDPSAPADKTVTITPQNDPPVAGDDSYHFVGNTELRVDTASGSTTPHVLEETTGGTGVLENDADPAENDAFTVTGVVVPAACPDTTAPFVCPTVNGGQVTLFADGSFFYLAPPGDAAASDSFQYQITDDGLPAPASDIGLVTLNRVERVWYVENDGPAGNGTSTSPFNTLTPINGAGGAGDSDSPVDYIFVYFGDGTSTGQAAGLVLENGQHLLGEHAGLSIPVNLNGNGSPTVLHAGTPGSRPLIDHTGAGNNALSATDAIPVEIVGLSLRSVNANAIDLTLNAAFAGSGTLGIRDNVVRGAGAEGIEVNAGGTGALTLNVQNNTWDAAGTHTGNAVDIARTGGTLNLGFSGNTNIRSGGAAVLVAGGAAASTTITGFAGNSIHGDTVGAGVTISGATFDAVPGGAVQQVDGDNLPIGSSGNPVGAAGMSLTTVLGNLFFDDLDIFAGTSGLTVNGAITFAVTPASPDGSGTSTIDADNGAAVDITSATIDLRLQDLDSSTSGSGVNLNTVGGQFRAPSGSTITKSSGAGTAFAVASSSATVDYAGTLNVTSGAGVGLTNNTGAANFTGQLTLSTGTNPAFSATGASGTVTATHASNTLTTTTGTALNVNGPDIGVGGMVFTSISANGAPNGIVLQDTGATAGLTVSGTGSAGSGGTIQNITNRGASFVNAVDVDLDGVNFSNAGTVNGADPTVATSGCGDLDAGNNLSCNAAVHAVNITGLGGGPAVRLDQVNVTGGAQVGINLNNVTGLSLTSTSVSGVGNQVREHGLKGRNVLGTVTFTNLNVGTTGNDDNFVISNNSGTATATITGSSFNSSGNGVPSVGGDGFVWTNSGTADIDITMSTTNAMNNFASGLIVGYHDPAANSAALLDFDVTGGTFTGNNAGMQVINAGSADVTFTIDGVNASTNPAAGVAFDQSDNSTASASLIGTVMGSTMTMPNFGSGNGVFLSARGAGTATVSVQNNIIVSTSQYGIHLHKKEGAAGTMNVTVSGNTVTTNDTFADLLFPIDGIRVEAGAASGDGGTLCAHISGNTVDGAGEEADAPGDDIRLRHRFAAVFQVPGIAGTTATDAINRLNTLNPAADTINATTTTAFSNSPGGNPCPTP